MKPLIVNLRGNNGSGKSTVARLLMKKGRPCPASSMLLSDKITVIDIPGCKQQWAVIGKYTTQCGGCDALSGTDEIIALVQKVVALGHNVFLEGVLMSDYYGKLGEYSAQFNERWVFAYMDTPVEECLRRVQARRKAKGNTKPFDPAKKLYPRHKGIERSRRTIEQLHERRTLTLPWQKPHADADAVNTKGRLTYANQRTIQVH